MTPRGGGDARAADLRSRFEVSSAEVPLEGRVLHVLHPHSAEDLIDEAAFERDERLPYWADIWPSSLVLASRLLEMEGRGRALLELGCGVGLVTVAASLAGFAVVATDYYADALEFTLANARLNGVAEPRTRLVDWRALPSDLGRFDVVVASDVLYERPYASLVAGAFAATLDVDGVGILADPGRVAAPSFLAEGALQRLTIRSADRVPYVAGNIRQTIDIYEITAGNPKGAEHARASP
jgi:ETFB lysine methyltransferase